MVGSMRKKLIHRLRAGLERRGFPRLQMMLLVALTGGAGFLCSYGLLLLDVDTMWLRYLSSVGVAYLAFLTLLWLWLRTSAEDYGDLPDEILDLIPSGRAKAAASWEGAGGRFGGGGASESYQSGPVESAARIEADDSIPDALGAAADAEELAIPIFLLVIAASMIAATFSIVYSAPVLFAELLLDGVLAATLYRHLKKLETRHWLETAIRRTLGPFVIAALVLTVVGWAMSQYAPEARSLGEVVLKWQGP
jgi:hypothetical protein